MTRLEALCRSYLVQVEKLDTLLAQHDLDIARLTQEITLLCQRDTATLDELNQRIELSKECLDRYGEAVQPMIDSILAQQHA